MATGEFSGYKFGTAESPGYKVWTYWSSKIDIAGNFSTVTCDHYITCKAGYDLSIGSRTTTSKIGDDEKTCWIEKVKVGTAGGTVKLGSTVHTIKHDSNGKATVSGTTTFPMNATIANTYVGNIVASGTLVLDDIPRASTVTVANGTLGVAQKFAVTRNDGSFSHAITYKCGTASGEAVAKTTNEAPPWTPPLSLASQNTTGNKVTVNFTITTYDSSGKVIGTSSASAEYTIPSTVAPTCALTVTDATNYKTTYGGYVQGKSKFKVTVAATPIYGSAIKSYRTIANGEPYTTASFTTAEIKNAGSNTITATVTDNRGNSGTDTETINVLEYYEPKLNIIAERCDADSTPNIEGANFKVTCTYNVAPLGNKNKFSISYKYRKSGEPTYTTGTLTNLVQTYDNSVAFIVTNIDIDSSYEIEVTLTDNFGPVQRATIVGSAFTFFHFDGPTSNGIGRNKLNVLDNGFTEGGPVKGIDYSFDDDTYTLKGNSAWVSTSHSVTGLSAGDIIRFKTVIQDSGGQVILFMFVENSMDSTNIATLSYIDGSTESYFEYTLPANFQYLYVEFLDNSGTRNKDIRFRRPILTVNNADMTYEQYIIGVPPRLGIGKIAELDHGADFGLKARFNAGFEFPIIRQYTDLNSLTTPNFYIGENVSTYQYGNCPITGGTFYLEVVGAGINSVRQTITTCSKLHSVSYERFYYDGSWGVWRNCYHSEEILYNSVAGTTGTVTLKYEDGTDPDIEKFTYLDIYFMDNNYKDGGCVRITNLCNKVVNISMIEDGNSNTFIRRTGYTISTKALTPNVTYAGMVTVSGTTVKHTIGTNYIHIVKVVGIR